MLYNGQTIINKAKAVMREVNNRVNNLWKDPKDFPSGTTQTGVLHATRECAWPKEADKKAKGRIKSHKFRHPNWQNMTYEEATRDI